MDIIAYRNFGYLDYSQEDIQMIRIDEFVPHSWHTMVMNRKKHIFNRSREDQKNIAGQVYGNESGLHFEWTTNLFCLLYIIGVTERA